MPPPPATGPLPTDTSLLRLFFEAKALQFGEFTLKSGRLSPYFFNAARFSGGALLGQLAQAMARLLQQELPQAAVVFGPAYKGAALAVAVALEWSRLGRRDVGWVFNRKEAKTHGDAGLLVGRLPQAGEGWVLVDDVITDGGAKREALALLQGLTPAPLLGTLVIFDRLEPNARGQLASEQFAQETGVPLLSLLDARRMAAALHTLSPSELHALGAPPEAGRILQAHLDLFS